MSRFGAVVLKTPDAIQSASIFTFNEVETERRRKRVRLHESSLEVRSQSWLDTKWLDDLVCLYEPCRPD